MHAPGQYDDSDDEGLDGPYDGDEDDQVEGDADEIPDVGQEDVTEDGDDDSPTEDSDDDDDDDDEKDEEEEEEEDDEPLLDLGLTDESLLPPPPAPQPTDVEMLPSRSPSVHSPPQPPTPPPRKRSLSPAHIRRNGLAFLQSKAPRTFIVEAICAIPHPVPTHALASSSCMLHLITGSDDGYIRDYDIFSAVNGKSFLTAPQRHHANVVEGLMKSGQLRFWWENPVPDALKATGFVAPADDPGPVYSLAMHSDALWSLSGSNTGYINLYTVRHDPGRLVHTMIGHKGPVSALCLDYNQKGFLSAGWDGEAIQWDLNTGQTVRKFTSHGAQLAGIALRPISSSYVVTDSQPRDPDVVMGTPGGPQSAPNPPPPQPDSPKSDGSYDPLFDEPDDDINMPHGNNVTSNNTSMNLVDDIKEGLAMPGTVAPPPPRQPIRRAPALQVPKGAPPLLDPASYSTFSPDTLMTASVDGQVILWDRRVETHGSGVGRLWMSEKTPPWCLSACWSADGAQIYAGRRNETVDVWDVRLLGRSGPTGAPRLLKTLRNPGSSGVVSCVVAFPDSKHIACASVDNIRLWNVAESNDESQGKPKGGVQFKIIPGHHGGYISQMLVDQACRFLVSASSNRGWYGDSTRTVFVHDIKYIY